MAPSIRSRLRGLLFALSLAPLAAWAADGVPLSLAFDDFFARPVGPRGLQFSDALRAADGQLVRLVGYMVVRETPTHGRFQLAPLPMRLSEDADGDADDLPASTVTVLLDGAQQERSVATVHGAVELTGVLSVGRLEERSGRVSWIRLQLPPEALAQRQEPVLPSAAGALAPHHH